MAVPSAVVGTLRSQNKCGDCGDTWYPRGRDLSRQCPSCGSGNIGYAPVFLGGCGTALGSLALVFFLFGSVIAWCGPSTSSTPAPQPPRPSPAAKRNPATSLAHPPRIITLMSDCAVWRLDDQRKAVVERRARKGETFETLAQNADTTGVRLGDHSGWVSNECVR